MKKSRFPKRKSAPLISRIATALFAVGLFCVGLISAAVTLAPTTASAATGINQTVNYQGRLLTAAGAVAPDGVYNMEFQIWQDGNGCLPAGTCTSANAGTNNAGTLKWTEDWVYGTASPDNRVNVKNGYFSVNLGSITSLSGVNFNSDTLWLTTNIGNTSTAATFSTASGDGLMIPFKRLAANPYAINSGQLGGLTSGQFVQLGQGIQAATSTTNAAIGINQTGATANILDLQRGGADVQLINNSGQTLFRPTTDSQTALQVQKAGTTTVAFTVDSSNSRIGIGTGAPAYAVDAVGSVNASVSLKVAGTDVCTTSGCTPTSTSTAYIQNQNSGAQTSSNFWISGSGKAATLTASTSVTTPTVTTASGDLSVTSATGNVSTPGTFNSLAINKQVLQSGDSNPHAFKIASLPISTAGTYDHLHILVTLNPNWGSTSNSYIDATFANRNAFSYQWSVKGPTPSANATLVAYNNSGVTDIYLVFTGAATFTDATYTVLENIDATVYGTPTDAGASPTGTLIFDTSSATYPPTSAVTLDDATSTINATTTLNVATGATNKTINFGAVGSTANTTTLNLANSSGAAQTVNVGSTNGTSTTTIQGGVNSTTPTVSLQAATSGYIAIGTTNANTVQIGAVNSATTGSTIHIADTNNGTGVQGITIGNSNNAGNSVSIEAGSTGKIQIGNTSAAHVIQIGNGGTSTQAVTIGSTNSGSSTILQGAGVTETLGSNGDLIQTTTNSTAALQVQNAAGTPIFLVDTATSQSGNFLTYGGFEVGTVTPTGWSAIGSPTTFARNTAAPNHYGGVASLQLVTTATAANQGATTSTFTSAPPAASYAVSFYAEQTAGTALASSTLQAVVNGAATSCTAGITLNSSGFQRVVCPVTAGATVTSIGVQVPSGSAAVRTIYIDAVQLVTGSSPTPATNGAIQLRGAIDSPVVFQSLSNSTTAFQIQNSAGTSNLFDVDSLNGRIGVGTLTPGSTLDVNGVANATSYSVGGTAGLSSLTCSGGQLIQNANVTGGILTAGSCVAAGSGSANAALSNLSSVAINTSLLPGTTNTIDLGSTTDIFKDLYTVNIDTQSTTNTALTIGTTNATSITLGKSTVGVGIAGNLTATGGTVTLNNATSNVINYGTNGVAAPAFTTRSAGTKIVLYSSISGSATDYAIGINGGTLWNSVDTTADQFAWYGGTTVAATLSGTGNFTAAGSVNGTTGLNTGASGGTQRIDASGNLTSIGTYSGSGNITTTGGVLNIQGSGTNSLSGNLLVNGSTSHLAASAIGGTAGWMKIGTLGLPQNGYNADIKIYAGAGYNGASTQDGWADLFIRTSNGTAGPTGFGATLDMTRYGKVTSFAADAKLVSNAAGASATTYDVYLNTGTFIGNGFYTVDATNSGSTSWVTSNTTASDPGVNSSTVLDATQDFQVANTLDVVNSVVTVTGALSASTTLTGATINATTAYQAGGTPGTSVTCSGGQFLQNQVVNKGISTGGTCAAAGGANTALSNLSAVAINTSLLSAANNTLSLGSAGNVWQNTYTAAVDAGTTTTTLSVGGTNATAITIGSATATVSVAGAATTSKNLTVGTTAGSGTTFTNNGSTLEATLAVTDRNGTNGTWLSGTTSVPTTTVDIYSAFAVNQTTVTTTVQVPSPTLTTAGRIIYVTNVGTTSFTLLGALLNNGATATLLWNGTAWTFAGADGTSIINQNSSTQTANFKISGTGVAGGFQGSSFDTASAGALAIGGTNATSITIGSSSNNTTIQGNNGIAFNTNSASASFLLKTGTNAASAFTIQNSSSQNILNVDTTSGITTFGTQGTNNGIIALANNSNTNLVSIQAGVTASLGYTITLPTTTGSLNQCLSIAAIAAANESLGYSTCGGTGGANTALSNLSAVAINTSLLPATTNTIDLGSSTDIWNDLYTDNIDTQTTTNTTLTVGTANATAISVANNNAAHTISIGNGGTSTAQTVGLGSTGSTSTTTIQGGVNSTTPTVSIQAATNGYLAIGTINLNTVQIGAVGSTANASVVHIADSSGAAQTVGLGSTNGTGTTTIQAGSGGLFLQAANVNIGKANTTTGTLLFNVTGTTNQVGLVAGSGTANYTLTLPTAAPTAGGQCVTTASTTALAFGTCGGGGAFAATISRAFATPGDSHGTNVTTVSYTIQHVGDLVVVDALVGLTSDYVTSIASTVGVTGWQRVTSTTIGVSNPTTKEVWIGTATGTGASTITVTWTTAPTSSFTEIIADSLTAGLGAASNWSVDQASASGTGSGSTMAFPSFTAAVTGGAYWASASATGSVSTGGGGVGGGSPAGATYTTTAGGSGMALYPSVTAGTTYSPTMTQSTSTGYTVDGILVHVSGAGNSYINDSLSTQLANFNVQASTSGTVAAKLQANAAGTGDILDLLNGAGATVGSVGSTGNVAFKPSTASTTAFQVQNTSAVGLLTVDSSGMAVTVNNPNASAGVTTGTDSFNSGGSALPAQWTLYRKSGDTTSTTSYNSAVAGDLRILPKTTAIDDCWTGTIGCVRVLEATPTTGDLTIVSKFDTNNNGNGSGDSPSQGIFITSDATCTTNCTFLRFDKQEDNGTGAFWIEGFGVTAGTPDNGGNPWIGTTGSIGDDAPVWVKVTRVGTTWTEYYSLDGINFSSVGSFTEAISLAGANAKIGMESDTGVADASYTSSDFDYFNVTSGTGSAPIALSINGSVNVANGNFYDSGNFLFNNGSDHNISISPASSGAGNNLTIAGGTGATGQNGGNLYLEGGSGASGAADGGVIVRPNGEESTSVFQVQDAFGAAYFNVDTYNTRVALYQSVPFYLDGGNGAFNAQIKYVDGNGGGLSISNNNSDTFDSGGLTIATHQNAYIQADTFLFQDNGGYHTEFSVDAGGVGISPGTNGDAFSVQTTGGVSVLDANTSTGVTTLGQASSLTGQLTLANASSAFTVSLVAGVTTGASYTLTLPTATPGTSQCLQSGASTATNLTFGACGGSTHTKTIVLTPEYAGAVLDSTTDTTCSAANVGTMTDGFDGTNFNNYYNWTATSASSQCYDVVVQVPVPSDWASWASSPMNIQFKSSNITNTSYGLAVLKPGGTADTSFCATGYCAPTTQTTSWSNMTPSTPFASSGYTAGSYFTVKVRMGAKSSASLQLGTITLTYTSAY